MDKVNKADIRELATLQKPPQLVKEVMSATMILLGEENPQDYRFVLKAFNKKGDESMLVKMTTIKIDAVSVEAVMKARTHIEGITVENVRNVSNSIVSVFKWVQCVIAEAEKGNGSAKSDQKTE